MKRGCQRKTHYHSVEYPSSAASGRERLVQLTFTRHTAMFTLEGRGEAASFGKGKAATKRHAVEAQERQRTSFGTEQKGTAVTRDSGRSRKASEMGSTPSTRRGCTEAVWAR